MPMTEKEVEAGLSLLHMMQPVASTAERVEEGEEEAAVKQEHGGVHASLLRVVASQADLLALACAATPLSTSSSSSSDDGENADGWPHRGFLKRNSQLTTLSRELSLDELRAHFNKPIVEVAKEFGICTTFLKKICRRCGIKRWPHRQIRSLSRTIQMLHQAEASAATPQERAKFAAQVAQLEAKKRAVIEDPDANGKLKRVKKCGAKQRGGAGSSGKSSSNSSSSATGDVDMEASDLDDLDDDADDADALRLLQMVGAQRSATPEIAPRSDAHVSTHAIAAAVAEGGGGRASSAVKLECAASSPVVGPLAAAVAKTPTTSALKAQRASAASRYDGADSAELANDRLSPVNHKLVLGLTKVRDADKRLRSASMGSLQDENEQPPAVAMLEVSI